MVEAPECAEDINYIPNIILVGNHFVVVNWLPPYHTEQTQTGWQAGGTFHALLSQKGFWHLQQKMMPTT